MPLLLVGGWRTLAFVLEYLLYHAWLHFTETHLRYTQQLPDLPGDLVNKALNFQMNGMVEILREEDISEIDLVTILRLTGEGGGAWTFTMRDGKSQVETTAKSGAGAEITSDIATYMKTTYYRMQNPLVALLLRKTRIKGMRQAQEFQQIYRITPSRSWGDMQSGRTTPK